jgi:hypothetical protein
VGSLSRQKKLTWRKSTTSASSNCVEIAFYEAGIHVRDSKNPDGPMLSFAPSAWLTFLADCRAGDFALPEYSANERPA